MSAPEPDDLRALGARLDEARGKDARKAGPPPTSLGIAFRFATELGVALFVSAGLGWLLDRWLDPKLGIKFPVFLVVMFVLGAAAGIRNVMRAAAELNAQMAASPASAVKEEDDEEK
jgi:ATP synthase protein I